MFWEASRMLSTRINSENSSRESVQWSVMKLSLVNKQKVILISISNRACYFFLSKTIIWTVNNHELHCISVFTEIFFDIWSAKMWSASKRYDLWISLQRDDSNSRSCATKLVKNSKNWEFKWSLWMSFIVLERFFVAFKCFDVNSCHTSPETFTGPKTKAKLSESGKSFFELRQTWRINYTLIQS